MTSDEGSSPPARRDPEPDLTSGDPAPAAETAVVTVPPAPPTPPSPSASTDAPASDDPGGVMSLVDHLAELRNRIVWSVLAIAAGAIVGFVVGEPVIALLRSPLPSDEPLITLSIGDAFAIRLRIAIVIGIILAMPVILWNLWRFVAPGLTDRERRAILPWIPVALVFFIIGVGIAYFILPYASSFLLSFQTPDLQAMLSAREYFDFVSTLFLVFGLIMEFPILLVALSRVGIVTSARLRRSRRVAILVITVFAALATPGGDPVSFGILALALYVLFEGTVLVIRRSGR
ncbi:MAG: twin-arginine translocase subunit TatC [Chloroflexi bacterium]|nr:twin-arginine translocase subunit TatC [Chloroflexota bacterium]